MHPNRNRSGKVSILLVLFMTFFTLVFLAVGGIVSFFFLGSDARALRNSFLAGSDCEYRQRIAVNVGSITAGIVRFGARFVTAAPPEARAGIQAFRGADVGVYKLVGDARPQPAKAFPSMDKRMKKRGWDPLVRVVTGREIVAVYVPRKEVSIDRVNCCFLVVSGDELVVGSARASLRSLLELPQVKEGMEEAFAEIRSIRGEIESGAQELVNDLQVNL